MNLSFSQFCSAGPEAYATLRRCVDERSRLGGGSGLPREQPCAGGAVQPERLAV